MSDDLNKRYRQQATTHKHSYKDLR